MTRYDILYNISYIVFRGSQGYDFFFIISRFSTWHTLNTRHMYFGKQGSAWRRSRCVERITEGPWLTLNRLCESSRQTYSLVIAIALWLLHRGCICINYRDIGNSPNGEEKKREAWRMRYARTHHVRVKYRFESYIYACDLFSHTLSWTIAGRMWIARDTRANVYEYLTIRVLDYHLVLSVFVLLILLVLVATATVWCAVL